MLLDILGVSPQNKMLIRLYLPAFLFMAIALLIPKIGLSFYNDFLNSVYLKGLAELVKSATEWGALGFMVLGTLTFIFQTYRLWKWDKGESLESCHFCGGMVIEKTGKYGDYHKCLACGSNRSVYCR